MAIVGSAEIVLTARLDRLERELRQAEQKVTGFSGRAQSSVGALGAEFGKLATRVGAVVSAAAAVRYALKNTVGAAIEYESAFAGVRKTVSGTEGEFAKLSGQLRKMSRTDVPLAATELAGIAESAGQLGIQTPKIAGFTKVIAQLGLSSNLSFAEGASSLARFANITGSSQDQFSNLGSTIVDLGNNFATTEQEVVAMALRLAGAGTTVGVTSARILGLAAALSSLGIEAEAGGSSVSKVLVDIAGSVRSGSEDLQVFADVAGVTVPQFAALFRSDAVAALEVFVRGLARMESQGQDSFAVLEQLNFDDIRVRDAFLRLANSGDLLSRALRTAHDAFASNTALAKEAGTRAATTESQIGLLKNTLIDMGTTLGDQITPALSSFSQSLGEALAENTLLQEAAAKTEKYESLAQTFDDIVVSAGLLGDALGQIFNLFTSIGGGVLDGVAYGFQAVADGIAAAAVAAVAPFTGTSNAVDLVAGDQSTAASAARRMRRRGLSGDRLEVAAGMLAGKSPLRLAPAVDPLASADAIAGLIPQGLPLDVGVPGAPDRPTPAPTTGGGKKTTVLTPQERLVDVLGLQRDLLDAATSQIDTQINLLERQKGLASEIAALEKQRLETIRASLDSQVALLRAQGTDAGGLARAEADLANVTAELAAPAAVVADEFERATVAAERLGSTLSEDILGSVKQFVVGVSQGTAKLGDLPRILSQSTAGNVTSRIFDSAFSAGGLFGAGTGAGDFGAFGRNLAGAFGADSFAGIMPADFVGPMGPGQVRAGTTAGNFATAGGIATPALAGFSTGQQVGGLFGVNSQESQIGGAAGSVAGAGLGFFFGGPLGAAAGGVLGGTIGTFAGDLFRDKKNKDQKTRGTLDEAFKRGLVFGTLALAEEPGGEFKSAAAPGFAAGLQGEFTALSLLTGLTGASATEKGPRNLGRRAGFLGLNSEQTSQQNRQVARATGKSIAEGVNDITVAFLRYQQEGKGAEITQADYNRVVGETVKLLQDDLPAGIDASVFALGALEKFGDQQVVNLETLTEKLQDVADAAQGFGSAFADGIARAVDSGNVMDVSKAIGESFAREFQDQAVAAILKSGAFAADLQSAIALTTEAAQLAAAGDFAGAAVLQARLGDTFSGVAGRAVQASAPLIQSVRGLEAALGVAAGNGVVRQGPSTLVTQVVVDGRVVQESQQDLTRLQRGGGVVVPRQISTR